MSIEIPKPTRDQLLESIQRYFRENMDEPIGNMTASALLDYFVAELGPVVYNQAVADVQKNLQMRVMEVDFEVREDEFQYWQQAEQKRKRK